MIEKSKAVPNPYTLEIVVPFSLEQSINHLKTCETETISGNDHQRILVETSVKGKSLALFTVKQQIRDGHDRVKTTVYEGSLYNDSQYNVTTVTCKLTSRQPYVQVFPQFSTFIILPVIIALALLSSETVTKTEFTLGLVIVTIGTMLIFPLVAALEARYAKALLRDIEKVFTPHGL